MTDVLTTSNPLIGRSSKHGHAWTLAAPARWQRRRLKSVCDINPPRTTKRATDPQVPFIPMELAAANTAAMRTTLRPLEDVTGGFTTFQDGDVLVAKITPCFENGKGGVAASLEGGVGFGSTEFHVLRPSPLLDPRYLHYLTISKAVRDVGTREMTGSAGQQRVPQEFFADLSFGLPDLEEQRLIVRYLDHHGRKVNDFIRAKRRLIDLLTEQKQAITHQVVTRGLDPTVPLKPSGIAWLGTVPATWNVVPLKHLFTETDERSATGSERLLSLRMISGLVPDTGSSETSESRGHLIGYKSVRPGQLVMNRMRAALGVFGIVSQQGLVSPDYAVFSPRASINVEYALLLFKTKAAGTV